MKVELHFPVLGNELPLDHGYALYGAVSRLIPRVHQDDIDLAIAPIHGLPIGNGRLRVDERSRLRLRLPAEQIPLLMPLAGKALEVDGCHIRLGVPNVVALVPAPALFAATVTTKNGDEPERFLTEVRRQMGELGVKGNVQIPNVTGPAGSLHIGKLRRRVLRIKDRTVVGWSLLVIGLGDADSLTLQAHGLGGRRKLGAGWFVPAAGEGDQ
jgi:CRISPR-associated protein Cas6